MKSINLFRATSRILLIIIPIFVCYVTLFWGFKNLKTQNISYYEKRFEGLRHNLPSRGVVGYISDDTNDGEDSKARMFVAQYALAPVIIVRSLEHELVIGNFRKPVDEKKLCSSYCLTIIKDFGNGVFLFKRTAK